MTFHNLHIVFFARDFSCRKGETWVARDRESRVEVIVGLHCCWLDINAITGTEVQGIVIEPIS